VSFILKRIFLHKFSLFFFQCSQQGLLPTLSRRCVFFSEQVLLRTFYWRLIKRHYTRLEGCCLFFPLLHIFNDHLFWYIAFRYEITITVRDQWLLLRSNAHVMLNMETKSSKCICIASKNQTYLKEIWRKLQKLEHDEHALVPGNFPSMHYNEFPKLLEYNKRLFLKIKWIIYYILKRSKSSDYNSCNDKDHFSSPRYIQISKFRIKLLYLLKRIFSIHFIWSVFY
jgi:hypothetical protein